METVNKRIGSRAGIAVVVALAAAFVPPQPAAAASADGAQPAFRVDRNTRLDGPTVAFLKGLLSVAPLDREYLVVLSLDGQVLGSAEGTRSGVGMPDVSWPTGAQASGVVLVHSHPSSTSFSRTDLLHLSRPDVEAVIAIGADGAVYFAARGPRFVINRVGALYDKATVAVNASWRSGGSWPQGPTVNLEPHHAHIVAQGLATAGVIVYRASLPFDRARSYTDGRVLFAQMGESAASDVKDALQQ